MLFCATPISRGVVDLTEPISSAIEEKIVTALVAMPTGRNPPGQVIALGSPFRGGHMRSRPNVQTVQPGFDMQLTSVPYHSTPISCLVIGHVNPLGGRLDTAQPGRLIHLVSLVTG